MDNDQNKYPNTIPEQIGDQYINDSPNEKCARSTFWLQLDDIITATMPLVFFSGTIFGVLVLVINPNLKDSDLLKGFVASSFASAGISTNARKK